MSILVVRHSECLDLFQFIIKAHTYSLRPATQVGFPQSGMSDKMTFKTPPAPGPSAAVMIAAFEG